jgi:tetratricopeptide (TPR) repeat protein
MQGEAHLLAGRREQARQCVDRGLALASVSEEHGSRGWTLRLAGEVAMDHCRRCFLAGYGPVKGLESADHAAAHYREALAIAEELGMRPLQAHCHLGLGKLYRRIGRVGDARAELAAAVEMLNEMRMTHWLLQAEAELARTNASENASATVEHAG